MSLFGNNTLGAAPTTPQKNNLFGGGGTSILGNTQGGLFGNQQNNTVFGSTSNNLFGNTIFKILSR